MKALRLPIKELAPLQTTVTWGDSFAAMEVTRDFGRSFVPKPYYGRVYRLEDIPDLAARYGIPRPKLNGYADLPSGDMPDVFLEVQLWRDEPVRDHLT